MPELIVYKKGQKIFRLPLDTALLSIGRSSKNDLILTGDLVSRQHALLKKQGQRFWIEDKSSTGTTHNGQALIERVFLQNKSKIGISDWCLEFHDNSDVLHKEDLERQTQITQLTQNQTVDLTKVLKFEDSGLVKVMKPSLFIDDGGAQRFEKLKQDRVVVGTAKTCDVVLKDDFVSKKHLELCQWDDGFHVTDLGSTNGTFIDNTRVTECYVKADQEIKIGHSKIIISFNKEYEDELQPSSDSNFCGIIGESHSMRLLFRKIEKVAETKMTVLIQGETGTGKEMVARAIHDLSDRRNKPYIILNCAAISSNLIESELFGHEKGAFTGADRRYLGAFEQAHQGTLFLDEIGELPLELQAKVLRVLEYQTLRRVGASVETRVDVRIVAATHRNLTQMMKHQEFREDLYYRLNILPLGLPPLRERIDDIDLLAQQFITLLSARKRMRLTPEALEHLKKHIWPGNVRELKNTMMRALAFCEGHKIDVSDIDILHVPLAHRSYDKILSDVEKIAQDKILRTNQRQVLERDTILEALQASGGDKSKAARILGVGRSTLFRRIKSLNIESKLE